MSGRKVVKFSNKLARAAAKEFERGAFKAIGMALDLDADATADSDLIRRIIDQYREKRK